MWLSFPAPDFVGRVSEVGKSILVTGASGNAGREVVEELRARGVRPRVGSRRAPASQVKDSETVRLDFQDPDTFPGAVVGCEAVFLMRPPAISNTKDTLNVLIDAARRAGIRQFVFISVAGAGDNRFVPHHAVEQRLRDGGQDWTILRPGLFAQNLASAYRDDIVEDDRILLPAGRGRAAFVDLRDVAEVAVDALVVPQDHAGKTYTLTGPKAYSFEEVAGFLSASLGRTIRYVPSSAPGYFFHLLRGGAAVGQAVVQTILHVGLRFGQAEAVDPTLERLLGRQPRDVEQYIEDQRVLWTKNQRPKG